MEQLMEEFLVQNRIACRDYPQVEARYNSVKEWENATGNTLEREFAFFLVEMVGGYH